MARVRGAVLLGFTLLQACRSAAAPPVAVPGPEPRLVRQELQAMGTGVTFVAYTADEPVAREAFGRAFAVLHRLEALMTTWPHPGWPQSEVMAINAAAGAYPVGVSPETLAVIEAAQRIAELSGGAFDMTFAALADIWKFDENLRESVPDEAAIAARLPLVNFRDVVVNHAARTVFLSRPGMRIDLGGIAKGYIVDACVQVLRAANLTSFLVQAGGDLYVSGTKGGVPWRVGIRDPRGAPGDAPFAVAPIVDHAFSTAGDYERAFTQAGKRYHHILDPKTGHPATASRSVTIFAPTALLADSLDDVLFILGPERGLALLEASFPEVGAVIVGADNRVAISPCLRAVVHVVHAPTPGL